MTQALGIDVSLWQDDNSTPQMMDFEKSKAGGVEFAFIKASQANYADPDLLMNWANCKRAGIPRGCYHFMTWTKTAIEQARTFLSVVEADKPELMMVVDYECRTGIPADAGTCRAMLKGMLEYLKVRTTCKIAIYTSPGFWAEYGSADLYWKQYPLWLAHYTTDAAPKLPKPWDTWRFWSGLIRGRVSL